MLLSPSLPILNKPVSVSLVKSRVGTGLTKSGLGFSKIFPRPKPRPETVKNGPETSLAETYKKITETETSLADTIKRISETETFPQKTRDHTRPAETNQNSTETQDLVSVRYEV